MSEQTNAGASAPASQLEVPLREGEFDLITASVQAMRESGLAAEVEEAFLKDELVVLGQGKCHEAQRFFLNRYWTKQLGGLQNRTNESTIDTRFFLIDKGRPEQWFGLFRDNILPVAMQHKLPVALH